MRNTFNRWTGAAWTFCYRLSGGRLGGRIGKAHVLLLTTTGRRTGKRRTRPLIYVPDGGRFVLVASNGGQDRGPAWFANLQANRRADIQVRAEKHAVEATVVPEDERGRLWGEAVAVYKGYASYERKTDRRIPMVALTPVD